MNLSCERAVVIGEAMPEIRCKMTNGPCCCAHYTPRGGLYVSERYYNCPGRFFGKRLDTYKKLANRDVKEMPLETGLYQKGYNEGRLSMVKELARGVK